MMLRPFSLLTLPLALGLAACSGLQSSQQEPAVFSAQSPQEREGVHHLLGHEPAGTVARSSRSVSPARRSTAQPQSPLQNLSSISGPYRIGSGDVLQINMSQGSGDLSQNRITVNADGVVDLGRWGAYRLEGLTAKQAQDLLGIELQEALNQGEVQLHIIEHRSQTVRLEGRIHSPGIYPIGADKLSLAAAIAQGGHLLRDADMRRIEITRQGQRLTLDLHTLNSLGMPPERIELQNGDIVHFHAKQP